MEKGDDQLTLKGSCACSAVSYSFNISNSSEEDRAVHACYCDTCQKWSGGVLLAVKGGNTEPDIVDPDNQLQVWKSSAWAERAFCKTCGSSIYYRVTAPGPFHNQVHFTAGSLDKESWNNDLKFVKEVYIDNKPAAFCFSTGETPRVTLTRAQVNAFFKESSEMI